MDEHEADALTEEELATLRLRDAQLQAGEGPESADEVAASVPQGENGGLLVVDHEAKS